MNGEGCMCAAHSESECCCDVDWRTEEEMAGQKALEKLGTLIDRMKELIEEAESDVL